MLDKIPTQAFLKYCRLYISKYMYVHCDMRFSVIKISALLCFLNVFDISGLVFSY